MKIVLLFRNSPGALYFGSLLKAQGFDFDLFLEKGTIANKKKLKRVFRNKTPLLWPLVCIDILVVTIYSKLCGIAIVKRLFPTQTPSWSDLGVTPKVFEDANSDQCVEALKALKADVCFVYGTGILKEPAIQAAGKFVFNIHPGIVPQYRNVHGEFWAAVNKDFQNLGSTIMHLDTGIDTGQIALQKHLQTPFYPNIGNLKAELIELSGPMIVQVLNDIKSNKLQKLSQDKTKARSWQTPTASDIIFNLKKLFNIKAI